MIVRRVVASALPDLPRLLNLLLLLGHSSASKVWVPNWSSTSGDLGVFAYQPAEQIVTSEAKLGWRRKRW
jgi:hypothetical protein